MSLLTISRLQFIALIVLISLICFGNTAPAGSSQKKLSSDVQNQKKTERNQTEIRVKLYVEGDEYLIGEVVSYVSRELRSIPDVTLVKDNADWELRIFVKTLNGKEITSEVMLVFTVLKLVKSPERRLRIVGPLYSYVRLLAVGLGQSRNIKDLCQKAVASFDGEYLESEREKRKWEKYRIR